MILNLTTCGTGFLWEFILIMEVLYEKCFKDFIKVNWYYYAYF